MSKDRPTQSAQANPSPFRLDGGRVGVLLIHGFTGSPAEMRLLGEFLHDRGATVSAPLLPGHGTTPGDLDRRSYTEWIDHARAAYDDLCNRADQIFIGGMSFGAAIALNVAASRPGVRGILTYSPAVVVPDWHRLLLPIAKLLLRKVPKPGSDVMDDEAMKHLWSYPYYPPSASREVLRLVRETRWLIPELSHPLLVIRSTEDRTVPPEAGALLYERIGSDDRQLITLHDSGHVVTVDREWQHVAQQSWEFIGKRS